MKRLVVSILLLVVCFHLGAQPLQKDVMEAMERANAHFMAKYPDPGKPTFVKKERPSNLWTRGVYFEGLMALTELECLTGGAMYEPYRKYISDWGRAHEWMPRNGVTTRDADDYCCCQTYLDMYLHELGITLKGVDVKEDVSGERITMAHAEFMVEHADMVRPTRECMEGVIAAHGTPWVVGGQTKSEGSDGDWTWIDAVQMGLPVFSKLARLAHFENDKNAVRYTAQGWAMYETTRNEIGGGLLNVEDGLWWRDKDFVPPYTEPNGEDCYWSRGNGWVYAALVRAMDAMLVARGVEEPQCWEPFGVKRWRNIGEDAHFEDYKRDYLMMSEALLRCQRKDGFWNVSLHDESNYGGVELSGTALFVYGMAWGVRHGYLPKKKYVPIIYRTWEAMVKTCLHDDGFLGYVQGTGKEPKDSQPVTYDREPDFDDYGLGCFLLCGCEVVRLLNQ